MEKDILKELSREYKQNFIDYSFIPEGFFQMSYSLVTEDSEKYFLKVIDFSKHIIDSDTFLKKIEHLERLSLSLDFIPRILKTKYNQPYLLKNNKCYFIQDYIDGKLAGQEDTQEILEILNELHKYPVVEDSEITENFNSSVIKYRFRLFRDFFREEEWFRKMVGQNYLDLMVLRFERYKKLQDAVEKENLCYVHKDPLSNAIKSKGRIYIIDWDDLTISNKEADLWPLISKGGFLKHYETISGVRVDLKHCEYYALESLFLYYEAYIQRYSQNKDESIRQEVKEGIEEGVLGWFESIYKEFP
jgi:thiamine kinase-like enzyme